MSLRFSPYVFSGKVCGGHKLFWAKENFIAFLSPKYLNVFDADNLFLSSIKPIHLSRLTGKSPFLPVTSPCILHFPLVNDENAPCAIVTFPYSVDFGCVKQKLKENHYEIIFSMCTSNQKESPHGAVDVFKEDVAALHDEEKKKTKKKVILNDSFRNSSVHRFLTLTQRFSLFCWGPAILIQPNSKPFPFFLLGSSDGTILQLRYLSSNIKKSFLLVDIHHCLVKAYTTWKLQRATLMTQTLVLDNWEREAYEEFYLNFFNIPMIQISLTDTTQKSFFQWIEANFGDIEYFDPASSVFISERILYGYLCVIGFPRTLTFWWLQQEPSDIKKIIFGCVGAVELPQPCTGDSITSCCISPFSVLSLQQRLIVVYLGTGYGNLIALTLAIRFPSKLSHIFHITLLSAELLQNVTMSVSGLCVTSPFRVLCNENFWYIGVSAGTRVYVLKATLRSESLQLKHEPIAVDSLALMHQTNIMGIAFVETLWFSGKWVTFLESIDFNGSCIISRFETYLFQNMVKTVLFSSDKLDCFTGSDLRYMDDRGSHEMGTFEYNEHLYLESSIPQSTTAFKKGTLSHVHGLAVSPNGTLHCIVEDLANVYPSDVVGDTLRLLIECSSQYDSVKIALRDLLQVCLTPLCNVVQHIVKLDHLNLSNLVDWMQGEIKSVTDYQSLHWISLKVYVKHQFSKLYFRDDVSMQEDQILTFSDIRKLIQKVSTDPAVSLSECPPLLIRFIRDLGFFQWDLTHLQSSTADDSFGAILCFLLYTLNRTMRRHKQPADNTREIVLNSLVHAFSSCLTEISMVLQTISKRRESPQVSELSSNLSMHTSNLIEILLREYIHIQLTRSLASLCFLLEPFLTQSPSNNDGATELQSQLKKHYVKGCLQVWRICLLQSTCTLDNSYMLREKFLASSFLCLETKTSLSSTCPYCNQMAVCPPPYFTFQCNQINGTNHQIPISFLTLHPCHSQSGFLWSCTLCNHIFQWGNTSPADLILFPFTGELPQQCPLCLDF